MENPALKDLFLASLERCSGCDGFIPAFYARFMASSEEVQRKFRFTDFEKQHRHLLKSLRLIAGASAGSTEALAELRARAETHDRHHLNIRPELYELWLQSIVHTARTYDPAWTEDVESAWTRLLSHAISHMVRYY